VEAGRGQELGGQAVVVAHEHLGRLGSVGDLVERGAPHPLRIDGAGDGERVQLPDLVPRREVHGRARAGVIEPHGKVEVVGGPRASPPPLHVGGVPDAAGRLGPPGPLEHRGDGGQAIVPATSLDVSRRQSSTCSSSAAPA
jgi:hypothetical protein